jgi:hypothetical protein
LANHFNRDVSDHVQLQVRHRLAWAPRDGTSEGFVSRATHLTIQQKQASFLCHTFDHSFEPHPQIDKSQWEGALPRPPQTHRPSSPTGTRKWSSRSRTMLARPCFLFWWFSWSW